FKYIDDKKEKVETTNKDEFIEYYKEFGFNDAIDKDVESLSYLVEPVQGLWLLAMDSTMWYKNNLEEEPIVDGEFRQSTLKWIENVLIKAQKEKKSVIGMMHHGILEHYKANKKYYGEYVVNNNEEIAKMFSHYNMNFIFTGHFHSQDITTKKYKNGNFIYDIETGSLATHPCPYRIVNITKDQKITVSSGLINEIPSIKDFQSHAHKYVIDGTIKMASKKLKKFGVSQKDIINIATQVAYAYSAHLQGDENPPDVIVDYKGLDLWSKIVITVQKDLIKGWWNDIFPKDNELTVYLKNGLICNCSAKE
ncbi:MAG TPA: hypothetical protein PK771_15220, partial [Spirochaetota bacterium]|nr:hypothetical protein [Spirochaetota bacterium]